MKIVTVLRSGGIFGPEHVRWLYDQLDNKYEKICLSDIEIEGIKTIPLTTNYPEWWAKIERFDPNKILDLYPNNIVSYRTHVIYKKIKSIHNTVFYWKWVTSFWRKNSLFSWSTKVLGQW